MSLDQPNEVIDRFFDPVINNQSHKQLRNWLKKQKQEDIRTFLDTFNFNNHKSEKSILKQELERRELKANTQEKWIDRVVGFALGIFSTLLFHYITK